MTLASSAFCAVPTKAIGAWYGKADGMARPYRMSWDGLCVGLEEM